MLLNPVNLKKTDYVPSEEGDAMGREETEQLRCKLLAWVQAGCAAGRLPALLLDEEEIRCAGTEELRALARRYAIR